MSTDETALQGDGIADAFGDLVIGDTARLQTQIAAVSLLFARQDRDHQHHDILLATIFELLSAGGRTTAQLDEEIQRAWPGLRLLQGQLETALTVAETTRMIEPVPQLGGVDAWSLLPPAREELAESGDRAGEIVERFTDQVADELRDRLGEARGEDLAGLVALVVGALRCGISQRFEATAAPVEQVGEWLRVTAPEAADVEGFIRARTQDPDRRSLALSLVTTALDRTFAFGTELVHSLAVGYLLYQFMNRPDQAAAAAAAGPLDGQVLLLDTPVLLSLAGPRQMQGPTLDLLAAAARSGMEVRLYERTVAEYESHLDTLQSTDVPRLDDALAAGGDPTFLAATQRSRSALRGWMLWVADSAADRRNWRAFRDHLESLSGPLALLAAMGVRPTPDTPYADLREVALFEAFRDELDGRVNRAERVVAHDAHTLVELERIRGAQAKADGTIWPGAFILTIDRHLDDTYTAVAGEELFPVALTFSQCTQLLGSYSEPRVSEALAWSVADSLADIDFLSRATAVPSSLAHDLAVAVVSDPLSPAQIEQLNLDLREAIASQKSTLEPGTEQHAELVARVAEQHRERRRLVAAQNQAARLEERRRTELVGARRDGEVRSLRTQNEDLTGRNQELESQVVASTRRGDRMKIVNGVAVVSAVVAVVLFVLGRPGVGVAAVVLAVVWWITGRDWAHRDNSSFTMVILVALLGLAQLGPPVTAFIVDDQGDEAPVPTTTTTSTTTTSTTTSTTTEPVPTTAPPPTTSGPG